MKIILDTNVLISATITKGTCYRVLHEGLEGDHEILLSSETIQEFRNTLLDYPEKFKLTEEEVRERVEMLEYFGTFVDVSTEVNEIEEDPSDDVFLELAKAVDADYIVSGDAHLLDLGSFRGTEIVEPGSSLEILESE